MTITGTQLQEVARQGIAPALVEDLVANSYELVVSRMPHHDQPAGALGAAQTHEGSNATPQATSGSDTS